MSEKYNGYIMRYDFVVLIRMSYDFLFFSASGRCVVYRGNLCKNKKGKKVFIPMHRNQDEIEKTTRKNIEHGGRLTKKCQPHVHPLLCELNFPYCDESSSTPKGKPICKDECLALKDKYCKKEYTSADSTLSFDCLSLQAHSRTSGKCSVIGVDEGSLQFNILHACMYRIEILYTLNNKLEAHKPSEICCESPAFCVLPRSMSAVIVNIKLGKLTSITFNTRDKLLPLKNDGDMYNFSEHASRGRLS